MKKTTLVALSALAFSACSINTLSVNDIQDKEFQISHFVSKGQTFKAPENTKATISFDNKDKRVFGVAACNRFFGSYEDKGNKISIEKNLASTKMLCDKESMAFESNLLRNLTGDFQISSNDEEIVLENKQIKLYLK